MAVLIEILCVIIRRDAIERSFRGGWAAFARSPTPNRVVCCDEDLVCFGFMALEDARAYISVLEAAGLTCIRDGQAADIVLVHQQAGLSWPAPWLEVGHLTIQGRPVLAGWLAGKPPDCLAVPPGWRYEGSATERPCSAGEGDDGDCRKFLRHERGVDIYLDLLTGKEVYVGRVVVKGDTPAALTTQLRAICSEALSLETKLEQMEAAVDSQGAEALMARLQGELLPETERIAKGPGTQLWCAHFAHGLILRVLFRRQEAEVAFREANELCPGEFNVLQELVKCLAELKKPQEALPFARQAVEVHPVAASAWGNLAMCLLQCGEREEALSAIDHAINLDPQDKLNRQIREKFERYLKTPA
jgi:hypothetical protein